MYPAKFDYHRPSSVQEAVSLLQANPDAKVLAGGHSLLPAMKLRLAQPAALVDIGRIPGLSGVSLADGRLRIGPLTTHAELASSELVRQHCPLLAEAAGVIGDRQVRHRGTIGGNLVHADPASDLPAVVVALDGVLHLTGPGGERQVSAADFFVDLLTTDIQPGELLTAIEVNTLGAGSGSCYLKFEHPASGYAVCGAAAIVQLDGSGRCSGARLALNGVSVKPVDGGAVTGALVGQALDDATIDQAVDAHLSIQDPIGDIYASEAYRQALARSYAKQALKLARDRARG